MQVDCGLYDLADDESGDVLRESLPLPHVIIQIVAVDILRDDVDMRLAADGLLVLHYLRMGDDLHDFALVVQCGDCLLSQFLCADVFQCEGTA